MENILNKNTTTMTNGQSRRRDFKKILKNKMKQLSSAATILIIGGAKSSLIYPY